MSIFNTDFIKQSIVKSTRLLKPKALVTFCNKLKTHSFVFGFLCILIAFALVLLNNDVDFEQGVIFKMLYIHVPCSWWALGIYAIMTGLAVLGFITRIPQLHILAACWTLPGITFTVLSLLSGMLWGKLTWGTFWVWDARLTLMFLHFLIYICYALFVYGNRRKNEHHFMIASILLVIGFINLPLIKWSVDWWFTLHQPASITFLGKNKIHTTYLLPLFLNAVGFFLWAFGIFLNTLKKEMLQRER